MNIFELFKKLEEADDGLLDLNFEDHTELLNETQQKIDAFFAIKTKLQAESARHMSLAEQHLFRAKMFDRQIERLEEYLKSACQAMGVKEFKGNEVRIRLVEQNRVRIKPVASEEDCEKYPAFCHADEVISYVWDKPKVLEAFKKGDPQAKEICEEYKSTYLRFTI